MQKKYIYCDVPVLYFSAFMVATALFLLLVVASSF